MIKKFECWDCGCEFGADDAKQVECPDCHSDNVEYASYRIPQTVKKGFFGIVVLTCLSCMTYFFWSILTKEEINPPVDSDVVTDDDSDRVTVDIPSELLQPPSLEASELIFKDNGYNFEVLVHNAPKVKFDFVLLDAFDDNIIISKSNDGKFEDVPFSEAEGGSYRLTIRDKDADTLLCAPKVVSGFIRQVKVANKMSVDELQKKIESRDLSLMGQGENDYLSPDCKLKFIGLSANAKNKPEILAEVFEKIDNYIWESVKVSALEYDNLNRINVITFKVVEGDGF